MRKGFYLFFLSLLSVVVYAQQNGFEVKRGSKGIYLEHMVAPKEGMYAIGRMYIVHPKYLAQYNGWDISKGLSIGQIVQIPLSDTNFTQKAKTGMPVYYVADAEDNLLGISTKFSKLPIQKIKEWNSLKNDQINIGGKYVVGYLKQGATPVVTEQVKLVVPEPEKKKEEPVIVQKKEEAIVPPPVEVKPPAVKKEEVEVVKEPAAKPIIKSPATPKNIDVTNGGYFKVYYDDQYKSLPASKNETVMAGIFKTANGWQDGKYYLLKDGIAPGTVVKIVNPDNRRLIYAKVLGEMSGIHQNKGYDIRMSDAAANVLGISDVEKFVVNIIY